MKRIENDSTAFDFAKGESMSLAVPLLKPTFLIATISSAGPGAAHSPPFSPIRPGGFRTAPERLPPNINA
jgi:hypothetical protein